MIAYGWLDRVWGTVSSYCAFYVQFANDQWRHLTPVKYSALLIAIALVGFLMMGRGNKRT